MNVHKNARLTPLDRERLVRRIEGGTTFAQAAAVCGVSARTASKWYRRFEAEGLAGLTDRSSRPGNLRNPTPQATCARIIALRHQRLTGAYIAAKTGVSPATVSRVLRRAGLSRKRDLEPAAPAARYEYDAPGGLIHLDTRKLGRFDEVGHRITGDRTGQSNRRGTRAAPAGNTCMSASMTPRGCPSPRCILTRRR